MGRWWQACRDSGPFWMVVAGLCFGVMGVFVKLGSQTFSTAELVFYRCLAGFVGIMLVVLPQRKPLWVSRQALRLHLSRGISGFVALMLYFYAIAHLPLATATTLNYTSPLFMALVMWLWQGQRLYRRQMATLALGFVGVILLLQPVFSPENAWPMAIGLGSGLLASVAYINVSELGRAGEPEWRTVFYFSLISCLGAGVLMLMQSRSLAMLSWETLPWLLGMGVAATCAQLAMTRAHRKGKSLFVVGLAYLTVLFSALFSAILWGDTLPWLAYLGMVLIAACGIFSSAAARSG